MIPARMDRTERMERTESQEQRDPLDRPDKWVWQAPQALEDPLVAPALSPRVGDWSTHAGGGQCAKEEPHWSTREEWQAHTLATKVELPTTSAWETHLSTSPTVDIVTTPSFMEVNMSSIMVHAQILVIITFPVSFVRLIQGQST